MLKRHRDLLHALQPTMDDLGVGFIDATLRGSGHLRLRFDLGDGVIGWLGVANSPSCPRNTQNVCRNLRMMVREKRNG